MNTFGEIKQKDHDVITFKITVNEDAAKKQSIEKFMFLVLGENDIGKIRSEPLPTPKLFRDIYADVDPNIDITGMESLKVMIKKYKDLYDNRMI